MTRNILDQIKVVVEARRVAENLTKGRQEALRIWREANFTLLEAGEQAEAWKAETEAKLRAMAVEIYKETGSKAPAPGVGIRLVTALKYIPEEAFGWAVEHKMALKLDVSAFEKIVKASPLPFVEVSQDPQATIATDLDKEGGG